MKTETTYIKTLGKVEAKLSRMKEQAAAVRWFYENGNLPESYNRALRLEELSEQTVLLTRVLPAYTGAAGATVQTDAIISLSRSDLRPRDGSRFAFRHCCRRKRPVQRTISGLIFIRLCGSSLMASPRSAFGIVCLPTAMCMTEADRNGPCGITIISKPIWSRIFWRCMFCPTITRQFARITIAALPEARTARKSM